jgi:16S rRNA (cytidine1402-2'-O)-methyltransferase
MGTLYVVGTPIGNLEDITLRALRVLREVRLIAAEDTRRARTLLSHFEIKTPVTSYFEHSGAGKREAVLAALAEGDVALISEAGMPGLSDPGYDLIRAAIERDIPVVPVPGPAAAVCALVVSGLPTDSFVFVGFLPRRGSERRQALTETVRDERTLVFYEAPHRLLESLGDMLVVLGDRRAALARELTKVHEEVFRGRLSEAIAHFTAAGQRGEFTVVVEGATQEQEPAVAAEDVLALARSLVEGGLSARDAAAEAARQSGWARKAVYELLHRE